MINRDFTYCTSENCKNKCYRHKDYYPLDPNENYWFCDFNVDPNKSCEWRKEYGENR